METSTGEEHLPLRPTAVLAQKIVAGEIVEGKILFKDLFYFRPYARLIATVNEMPIMTDAAGLARRVLPLHCVKPFVPTNQERDRDLL